jgi:hypothetical protein
MANTKHSIRKDPDIMNFLGRLPRETATSLNEEQLRHIKVAIGSGQYRKHKVDIRGTFPIPFFTFIVYFVFLMGRNVRNLSRQEQSMALATILLLSTLFVLMSVFTGLIVLYILKSSLGINLLEGFSLGLWDWIKQLV